MADPITNAQFALGLFAPAAQSLQRIGDSRLNMAIRSDDIARADAIRNAENDRKAALMYWTRKMDREDAEDQRMFLANENNMNRAATLGAASEHAKTIAKQMEATDKKQRQMEVRKLYDEYSELTRDEAKPLVQFGEDEAEQFQNLAREVGKLKQKVLLSGAVGSLVQKYGELGGKEDLAKFGTTPAEQIQGLSKEIGALNTKRTRERYQNVSREIGNLATQIDEASKLTDEEMMQAKSEGLRALNNDAREAYMQNRKVLGEKAALAKVAKMFPDQMEEYNSRVNQTLVGLRIQKRDNDKVLRELYDNMSALRGIRAKIGLDLSDQDPDAISTLAAPLTSAQSPAAKNAAITLGDLAPSAATTEPTAPKPLSPYANVAKYAIPSLTYGGPAILRQALNISRLLGPKANPTTPEEYQHIIPAQSVSQAPTVSGSQNDAANLRSVFNWLTKSPQRPELSPYDQAMVPSYRVPDSEIPAAIRYNIPQDTSSFGEGWLYSNQNR